MSDQPDLARQIDADADAALAAVPAHLRDKQTPQRTGSTRLRFSHARPHPEGSNR
ncbi:hypothetical protein [Janibacter sp. GS2]|uniref:hypothetical protein n=1 Tax=Janibacter sp. GS2 TaxID=3442646 RepID=UPI003EB8F4B2